MARRIPVQTVTVVRGGKRYQPPHGKAFDFTDDEIEHFTEHAPGALKRVVVAEDDHDEEIEQVAEQENSLRVIPAEDPPAPPTPKGGKKTAEPKGGKKTTAKKPVDSEIDGL